MMKKYLLLLLLCSQFVMGQFIAEYQVYHRIDSAMAIKDVIPYYAKLFVNGNKTLYVTDARIQSDSLRLRFKETMDLSILSVSKKKGNKAEYITGDLVEGIINQHVSIHDSSFKFTTQVNNKWILDNEVRQIGVYIAKKSHIHLSGRNYTVWYTTEVPFPVGPFKFYGLPGLVLEAYDDTGDVRFELVSVKNGVPDLKKIFIENTNEKIVKSYDEYLKIFKMAMHSRPPQNLYEFADAESKQRLEENYQAKLRRYNNFIEK